MPDYMFKTYRDVTPDFLARHGITALLLDIDNTFAPYEQPEPDDEIRAWIDAAKSAGITLAFVSNNNDVRVELFNRTLGLPAFPKCGKPGTRKVKKIMAALRLSADTTAVLGDQLLTDACTAGRPPQTAIPAMNAAQPQQVEQRRTGKTALSRTLAFFARS